MVCCPYPLFHISGLCIGLLSSLTQGAAIVYPSSTFDPSAVLQAVVRERCTTLHGVPTIFVALLERYHELNLGPVSIRAGLLGGASIPISLLKDLQKEFGFADLTVAYGNPGLLPFFPSTGVAKILPRNDRNLPYQLHVSSVRST